jgi:type IV pilus modification protein PilV
MKDPRAESGFTLIEVLVAMVILAIGLLGLEALGIGASRAITLSDKQSRYATLASQQMEVLRYKVRSGTTRATTGGLVETTLSGRDVVRVVDSVNVVSDRQARLMVKVFPTTTGNRLVRADTLRITSYMFQPNLTP